MWTSVSFATLSDLLLFLNVRRLAPPEIHVVVARDDDGTQLFHLLLRQEATDPTSSLAVQEAELLPVVEGAAADEAAAAVEAAEDFLHGVGEKES